MECTNSRGDSDLTADGLLVLFAARVPALVGFDAEAGAASGSGDLTGGTRRFLLVLEQLHQQLKLKTAAHLLLTGIMNHKYTSAAREMLRHIVQGVVMRFDRQCQTLLNVPKGEK